MSAEKVGDKLYMVAEEGAQTKKMQWAGMGLLGRALAQHALDSGFIPSTMVMYRSILILEK